jgi:hypothetical protein
MDLTTKIFLTNWITLTTVITLDKYVFNEKLTDMRILGPILLSWLALSVVSVPFFVVALIWFS